MDVTKEFIKVVKAMEGLCKELREALEMGERNPENLQPIYEKFMLESMNFLANLQTHKSQVISGQSTVRRE